MTFLDGHSHYLKVALLKSKDEAEGHLKGFIERAEVETGQRVNYFHSDGSGEYTSESLKQYLTSRGIHHELTNADTPQENGAAEQINQTILDMACFMLKDSELPEGF